MQDNFNFLTKQAYRKNVKILQKSLKWRLRISANLKAQFLKKYVLAFIYKSKFYVKFVKLNLFLRVY